MINSIDDELEQAQRDAPDHLQVSVAVEHEGRVLLIRVNNSWDLPTCAVDPSETALEALDRMSALGVEHGLAFDEVTGFLGSYDLTLGDGSDSRVLTFTAATTTPDAPCHAGRVGHRWASRNDLSDTEENTRRLLTSWFSNSPWE
ncbi:hypothetical protein ABT072_47105 [Streptomyces sp. NPDC002589]|uniref:hypothetical protein n=1 Tax=Streptomyces sp. NPDC002589 TaxID=3154420 RepID=UPI003331879F